MSDGLWLVFVGGSESRLASSSQQCVAASHSGSVDTSPTAVTATSTASAAAAVCSVSSWSSHDVQTWLHNNELDSLTDRFLWSVVVIHLSLIFYPEYFFDSIFKYW